MDARQECVADVLCPERDALAFRGVVERALASARRQIHRGSPCSDSRCDRCGEVVGSAYEVALVAYRAEDERSGWSASKIAKVARNAHADGVRKRLSEVGVGARPERWLGQRSFLPTEAAAGRALVVATVLAVAYYSVLPASGSRILVDDEWLGRMLDGLRPGDGRLAAVRRYWCYDSGRDRFADVRRDCRRALDSWRLAKPDRYAALLVLNDMNAGLWSSSVEELGMSRLAARESSDHQSALLWALGRWLPAPGASQTSWSVVVFAAKRDGLIVVVHIPV